jgi:putative ABC transport system permease protein
MELIESFRIAIQSLFMNRLRAVLTMLGIIIGVAAVITLLTLGRGVESYVASQFDDLGADLVTVQSTRPRDGLSTAIIPLTLHDVTILSNPALAPSVASVAAVYQVSATAVIEYDSVNVSVQGVTANYAAVNRWETLRGAAFFTQNDIDSRAQVAFLGTTTVEDLYGDASFDPTGTALQIDDQVFNIIGVMEEKTATFNDPNQAILVPISTAQTRLDNARVIGNSYAVSEIQAQVMSGDVVEAAINELEGYFMAVHRIRNPFSADFEISNPAEILESANEITGLLTIFLSGIAAISLLVGGIGVMNIMFVSVSERTREIGLRKAVGAQAGDILGQFLVESIVLSLFGGGIGIALSWGLTKLAGGLIPDIELMLTPDVVLLATGVSSFIGIFFGMYPANRAARMRPIDALRHE